MSPHLTCVCVRCNTQPKFTIKCKWVHISPVSVWARERQPAPRALVTPGIESAGTGDLMPGAANWNKSSSVFWSFCLFRWNVFLHFQSLLFSAVLKRVNIVEWFPHINIYKNFKCDFFFFWQTHIVFRAIYSIITLSVIFRKLHVVTCRDWDN